MIDNTVEEVRKHFESIMDLLNIERNQSNENTPLRISKMMCNELFTHRNNNGIQELDNQMKVFDCDWCTNPVTIKDIPVQSVCEHHWLPMTGTCSITYLPKYSVIGLSKVPRVVKFFSRKPQLQERLTTEIGEYLVKILDPQYLIVNMTCEHLCVKMRGVETPCLTDTVYSYSED